MTQQCSLLADALAELEADLDCSVTADGNTLLVTTGRFYSDGDVVEVFVRVNPEADTVIVSDGGITTARRALFGLGAPSGNAHELWGDILDDFGLHEAGNRIYGRGPRRAAASLIGTVADAALTLDSLRLMATGKTQSFPQRVQGWLRREAGATLLDNPVITMARGGLQKVTAVALAHDGRHVAVQAAAARGSGKAAMEHAFFVFAGIDQNRWPVENRLIVVDSVTKAITRGMSQLTDVAYVSTLERAGTVRRFLEDGPPVNRDIATETFGQASTSD